MAKLWISVSFFVAFLVEAGFQIGGEIGLLGVPHPYIILAQFMVTLSIVLSVFGIFSNFLAIFSWDFSPSVTWQEVWAINWLWFGLSAFVFVLGALIGGMNG